MILLTVGMPTIINIRSSSYAWTESGVSGEYYVRLSGGGNPNLSEPSKVQRNDIYLTKGTVGTLAGREWGYGTAPGQSYSTIYVRLYDGSDPDAQTKDIAAIYYTDYRCSNEAIPLEHYWYPYAMSFGSIKYQIDQIYGGYCRLSYGSISFMPELFADYWPPPESLRISAEYTDTTEAGSVSLFDGTLHIKSMDIEQVSYDIYDAQDYQINTLQESITNDSEQIDIRSASYKWTLSSSFTYYLELASGGNPAIGKPDAVLANYVDLDYNDEMTSAGLSTGEWGYGDVGSLGYDTIYVRLSDSTDPDTKDASWILAIYGINPLPMAFGTVYHETPVRLIDAEPGGNYRYWLADIQGTVDVDWHVYDDGVDICANVENVANGIFELNAVPVGNVTISGTGSNSTLVDIFDWACETIGLTLDDTYTVETSSSVSKYIDSQTYITDFLSDISAFFTHLFYIRSGTLFLVDMLIPAGSETTSEFDFFSSNYSYNSPIKRITSSFPVRSPGEWSDGAGGGSGYYVKETISEISVASDYPYSDSDQDVECYVYGKTSVKSHLDKIMTIINRPQISMKMPFGTSLISPGTKITWTNESFPYNITTEMYARSVSYDFDQDEISIDGDCEVSA